MPRKTLNCFGLARNCPSANKQSLTAGSRTKFRSLLDNFRGIICTDRISASTASSMHAARPPSIIRSIYRADVGEDTGFPERTAVGMPRDFGGISPPKRIIAPVQSNASV